MRTTRILISSSILIAMLGAFGLFGFSGVALEAGASSTPKTGKALVAKALAAGKKATSVHLVIGGTGSNGSEHLTAKFSGKTWSAKSTAHTGTSVTKLTLELIKNTVYVRGNATSLKNEFSASTNIAHKYAEKWLLITSHSPDFKTASQSASKTELLSKIVDPANPMTIKGNVTVGGKSATELVGTVKTSTSKKTAVIKLDVATSGPPLPLKVSTKGATGKTQTATFTEWGQPVHLTKPAHAAEFSVLSGSGKT